MGLSTKRHRNDLMLGPTRLTRSSNTWEPYSIEIYSAVLCCVDTHFRLHPSGGVGGKTTTQWPELGAL